MQVSAKSVELVSVIDSVKGNNPTDNDEVVDLDVRSEQRRHTMKMVIVLMLMVVVGALVGETLLSSRDKGVGLGVLMNEKLVRASSSSLKNLPQASALTLLAQSDFVCCVGVDIEGEFLMYNKKYSQARLTQFGTSGTRDVGPFEGGLFSDQLWYLKEEPNHPDYLYIINSKYVQYRLAKWGVDDKQVGVVDTYFYPDQLWKFVPVGDFYRIFNKQYPNAKIAMWNHGKSNWGTFSGNTHDNQLWKLVPRFTANIGYLVLWGMDNRQGSQDFSETITITRGTVTSHSTSTRITVGYKQSLTASAKFGKFGTEMTQEITAEIGHTVNTATETTESYASEIKFTAPAGKNYRVLQYAGTFVGQVPNDGASVYGTYKVEETTGDLQPISNTRSFEDKLRQGMIKPPTLVID